MGDDDSSSGGDSGSGSSLFLKVLAVFGIILIAFVMIMAFLRLLQVFIPDIYTNTITKIANGLGITIYDTPSTTTTTTTLTSPVSPSPAVTLMTTIPVTPSPAAPIIYTSSPSVPDNIVNNNIEPYDSVSSPSFAPYNSGVSPSPSSIESAFV